MKKQHKNVIRRTVAVGLATLMFFVPLSTGMGKGMGAKADDPSSGSSVKASYNNENVPNQIDNGVIDKEILGETYKVIEATETDATPVYSLHVLDDSIEIDTTVHTRLADTDGGRKQHQFTTTLKGSGPNNESNYDVNVDVTVWYKVTYDTETICVKKDSTSTLSEYSEDAPAGAVSSFTLEGTDVWYVYARPVISLEFDKIGEVKVNGSGNVGWNDPQYSDYYKEEIEKIFNDNYKETLEAEIKTAYSLQFVYKRVVDTLDPDKITQDWEYTPPLTPVVVDGKNVYKSASINPSVEYGNTATSKDYYIGTFKHVVDYNGTVDTAKLEAEVNAIADTAWQTGNVSTDAKTGYYFDYVAYFVDNTYVKYLKTSSSVYIDADAPTVVQYGLFIEDEDNLGNKIWKNLEVEEKFPLNMGDEPLPEGTFDKYRYLVEVFDDSGVDIPGNWGALRTFETVTESDKFVKSDGDPIVPSNEKGTLYYYEIQFNDLPTNDNEVFELYVPTQDRLGNRGVGGPISPTVTRFKNALTVSVVLTIDGAPIEKPLSEHSNSNLPIKMTIEASSGFKIKEMTLYNNNEQDQEEVLVNASEGTVIDATHYKQTTIDMGRGVRNRYKATWEYMLPSTTDVNALYKKLQIEVKDSMAPYWPDAHLVKNEIGNLIYDVTVPVITYSDEYDGVRWYQDYKVSGNIVSGLQSVEDDFEYAEYYMSKSGSVDEVNDAPTKQLDADPNAQTPTCNFEFDVESSESLIGTKIVFAAKDKSGNILPDDNRTMVIHVDGEAPVIDKDAIYVVKKGTAEGKKVSSDSNLEGGNIISGNPVLQASVRDNLTIDRVEYTVKFPNGSEKIYEDTKVKGLDAPGVDYPLAFEIPNPLGAGEALDGSYEVTIQAYDKSGRESEKQSVRFVLDNTKPVLSSWISVGTKGGKSPREDGTDWYYKSDQVGVSFKIEDDNIDTSKLVVKDGDSIVPVIWTGGNGFATVSGNGPHTLTFEGKDAVGNPGTTQTISFIIDTIEPAVSVQVNGQSYSASRGRINSTQDVYVHFGTSDTNPDYNDYYCRIVRQLPGQADSVREYTATSMTDYSFSEDGDYTVTFYAIDRAGNSSGVYSAMFRVDKNAPQLQIVGANGSATSDTAVTLVVNEAMWQDATAEATIYRRAGDGKEELVYKTIQLRLTSAETRISELLRETGTYRIEFSAKDAIGHSTSTSHTFTLDKNAPIVSQTGVSNYDKTDQPVTFYTEIHDDFYATKTVVVSGTRTDQSGKVTVLEFPNVKQNANPTIIENVFEEDGIYEVSVYVRDAAGNEKSSVLHFVIDKEAPVIGSLEDYEDKMFREFSWDLDLDELVSDLTVCDVHMYLNGREYDGESKIEDGVYTLLITAEDELGHKSEKSVTFTLDTKAPVFIVTGVEDGEVKKEAYSIDISLQLDEDILELVMLNGVPATVRENNTAHIDVTQEGDYNLTMAAADKAGNESMQVISFTYGTERQKRNWLVVILASGGGVLALGGIIFFAAKCRRNR